MTVKEPGTRHNGRGDHAASPADDSLSDVSSRMASLRGEAFELVEELHARDAGRWSELERASEQMQSIANQLATVQALVARAGR